MYTSSLINLRLYLDCHSSDLQDIYIIPPPQPVGNAISNNNFPLIDRKLYDGWEYWRHRILGICCFFQTYFWQNTFMFLCYYKLDLNKLIILLIYTLKLSLSNDVVISCFLVHPLYILYIVINVACSGGSPLLTEPFQWWGL